MKIGDYEAKADEEWVLLEDEGAFSGLGSTIPSVAEVKALKVYVGWDAVQAGWAALPKENRRITAIWPKVPLLRRAIRLEEGTGGRPGAKRVYDHTRLEAIMAERGCGRVTAYKYLKAEAALEGHPRVDR